MIHISFMIQFGHNTMAFQFSNALLALDPNGSGKTSQLLEQIVFVVHIFCPAWALNHYRKWARPQPCAIVQLL